MDVTHGTPAALTRASEQLNVTPTDLPAMVVAQPNSMEMSPAECTVEAVTERCVVYAGGGVTGGGGSNGGTDGGAGDDGGGARRQPRYPRALPRRAPPTVRRR